MTHCSTEPVHSLPWLEQRTFGRKRKQNEHGPNDQGVFSIAPKYPSYAEGNLWDLVPLEMESPLSNVGVSLLAQCRFTIQIPS